MNNANFLIYPFWKMCFNNRQTLQHQIMNRKKNENYKYWINTGNKYQLINRKVIRIKVWIKRFISFGRLSTVQSAIPFRNFTFFVFSYKFTDKEYSSIHIWMPLWVLQIIIFKMIWIKTWNENDIIQIPIRWYHLLSCLWFQPHTMFTTLKIKRIGTKPM